MAKRVVGRKYSNSHRIHLYPASIRAVHRLIQQYLSLFTQTPQYILI